MNENEDTYLQRFAVPFEYPVHFPRGLIEHGNPLLADTIASREKDRRHRVLVYVDAGVIAATPGILGRITDYADAHRDTIELCRPPQEVPGGEAAKNSWQSVEEVMTAIGNEHLCRQSFVIAVGGGSVLDMVGFAASIVHRGLRCIRIPALQCLER